MAGRIRSIKPETLDDERPAGLSDSAWRLWVSMWLLSDDGGNCRASVKYLTGKIWWAHKTPPDVLALLYELEHAGSITRYAVRGQRYAHVERWEKHQRIDNAGPAKVPPPSEADPRNVNDIISPRAAAGRRSDLDLEGDRDWDLDPPATSAGGIQSKPKRSQKSKPERPEWSALLALYSDTWTSLHSLDGKRPAIEGADASALARVYDAVGVAETKALIQRFVSDTDPFIARRGYMLRDLPSRVNAYRAKQPSPGVKNALPLSTSVDEETRKKMEW